MKISSNIKISANLLLNLVFTLLLTFDTIAYAETCPQSANLVDSEYAFDSANSALTSFRRLPKDFSQYHAIQVAYDPDLRQIICLYEQDETNQRFAVSKTLRYHPKHWSDNWILHIITVGNKKHKKYFPMVYCYLSLGLCAWNEGNVKLLDLFKEHIYSFSRNH